MNIGPAFRGSYDSFAPVAPFPWFSRPLEMRDFRLENNSFLRFSSEGGGRRISEEEIIRAKMTSL